MQIITTVPGITSFNQFNWTRACLIKNILPSRYGIQIWKPSLRKTCILFPCPVRWIWTRNQHEQKFDRYSHFFLAWRLVKDDPRPPIIRVQGSERPLHLKWAPKTTNTPRHSRFRPNHFPTRRLSGVCRNHTGERPIVVQYPYWWGTDWTSYGSGVLNKVSALFNLLQTWYLQFSNVDVTSWHFY